VTFHAEKPAEIAMPIYPGMTALDLIDPQRPNPSRTMPILWTSCL